MPEAPAAFDTLDAREKWFDAKRKAIEKDYNGRLSLILSEYPNCYEGSFYQCERRVVALDKRRDSVLENLEQDRRYARTILPSRTVIVDGKKMCLVPDNDGQWQATASRAKPQTTEVTVDGQRKCLTKSGPATWREVSCPK